MACACQNRRTATFMWTSDDGQTQIPYPTEIQAKAKTLRNGGSYEKQ